MQDGGGMPFEACGIPTMPGFGEWVEAIRKVVAAAREVGVPVVYFQEVHRADHVDFGRELDGSEGVHCLGGAPDRVRAELAAAIGPRSEVSWRILECTEPSWTDPGEEMVRAVRENAVAVAAGAVVVNLRAGFSDARCYRHAGAPSVVYGVTPHGMGYATVEDMEAVFAVYAMAGLEYLKGE